MPSASVIISVYNKVDFFRLVVAGFERQTNKDFELVIADDGSNEQFVNAAKATLDASGIPYKYVWQEDIGWRKNKALNGAVLASSADWIIIIDGDCIPHSHFVDEHLRHAAPKRMLTGRRVNLMPKPSNWLTPARVRAGILEWGYLLFWPWLLKGYYILYFKGWYLPWLDKFVNRGPKGLLGCIMSMAKEDLLAINGFDERYNAPGTGEDSDPDYRLRLLGVTERSIVNIAVQYHLWHKELPQPSVNTDLFKEVKAKKQMWTPYGIVK
jgi:glycosyltransferase involved in cell wall biosynthesis